MESTFDAEEPSDGVDPTGAPASAAGGCAGRAPADGTHAPSEPATNTAATKQMLRAARGEAGVAGTRLLSTFWTPT